MRSISSSLCALLLAVAACSGNDPTPTGQDDYNVNVGTSFSRGDIFVSLKTGAVDWFNADGTTLRGVLTGTAAGHAEGMGFDAAGNLYVAHWCGDGSCTTGDTIEKFNQTGSLMGTFGKGYFCNPTSLDFDSNSGNVFVGQADCTGNVLEFASNGNSLGSFAVAPENRGSMWMALAGDGCTVLYTSQGTDVLQFNTCANVQLQNFNTAPLPDIGNQVRLMDDGGVLVATNSVIVRLDSDGNVAQTYTPAGPALWFGLALSLDGKSFLAANFGSSDVVTVDLATGAELGRFNTGSAPFTVKSVAIAAPPPQQVGGRMTGGGSIFLDDGTRVTHGFELHCDATVHPNHLEINWHPPGGGAGGRFHLESLTSATCTDDPTIEPAPPKAPFDTYEGFGTGRVDGVAGATAHWIFTDAGEPGVNDRIRELTITDASGNVVINLAEPGKTLTFGNHQAHK
jgi:hypothetical protein